MDQPRKAVAPISGLEMEEQPRTAIEPNGDLEIGVQVAQWDEEPHPFLVRRATKGKVYERTSGTIMDEDVQEARYILFEY